MEKTKNLFIDLLSGRSRHIRPDLFVAVFLHRSDFRKNLSPPICSFDIGWNSEFGLCLIHRSNMKFVEKDQRTS